MKSKIIVAVAAMLIMVSAAHAYDFDPIDNGIGDWNLLTLGGFVFARSVSIDLMPTNAPNSDARYSIRCQVVYKDKNLPRPETEDEKELALATGKLLNEWLEDFIADRYVGRAFAELLLAYYDKKFVDEINDCFPAYVAEKVKEIASRVRINITAVTVIVNAEDEFRSELVRLLRQEKDRP